MTYTNRRDPEGAEIIVIIGITWKEACWTCFGRVGGIILGCCEGLEVHVRTYRFSTIDCALSKAPRSFSFQGGVYGRKEVT